MENLSEKQLIGQLKQLKAIKPRQEWAVLAKSEIFSKSEARAEITRETRFAGFGHTLHSIFFQRKLAYTLSAFALLIVGIFGFGINTVPGDPLFPIRKLAEESQQAISGQTGVKKNVATLNSRISDLALVAKEGRKENVAPAITEVNTSVSELVKSLKEQAVKDPETIKEIAVSLKTLADVNGSDIKENEDVKGLYQTIVESQIADLEKATLTKDQEKTLGEIKDLYKQEKYPEALEKLLLINK